MADFLDRLGGLGGEQVTTEDPSALLAADSLDAYVRDGATRQHVVVGEGGVTRRADDWESTVEPGSGAASVVVVTDVSVLVLVGECRDPEVDGDYVQRLDLGTVERVDVEESFLSTEFAVTDGDGVTYAVSPVAEDGLHDVVTYVDNADDWWARARSNFDGLGESVRRIESALAAGELAAGRRARTDAMDAVSTAEDTSFRVDIDVPALERRISRARDAIRAAQIRGHARRCRALLDDDPPDARAVPDSDRLDRYESAASALADACEVWRANPDLAPDATIDEERDPTVPDVRDSADALLTRVEACLDRDWEGTPPDDRQPLLETLLETVDTLAANVDVVDRIDAERVDDGREAVVDRLSRTLDRRRARAEERGDECLEADDGAGARPHFETALECVERRRELADAYPDAGPDPETVESRRETVSEKLDRTEWVWGGN